MALYEKRILASVKTLPLQSIALVLWHDQIVDDIDGTVKSYLLHRCAYSKEQKDQFIADIENIANGGSTGMAAPYITALGW